MLVCVCGCWWGAGGKEKREGGPSVKWVWRISRNGEQMDGHFFMLACKLCVHLLTLMIMACVCAAHICAVRCKHTEPT